MKRVSREINIFSISALDLFASALGAFILLAVIMIPYFPNTGDDPERVAAIKEVLDIEKAEHEKTKQEKSEAEAAAAAAESQLAQLGESRSVPPFDVMVAVDTTGSMNDVVNGLKRDLDVLIEILLSLSDSPALGVVDFKDVCDGSRVVRTLSLRKLTTSSSAEFDGFVRQMGRNNSTCNNTAPEAVDRALRASINQNWRADVQTRIIIIATDNPAYANKVSQTLSDAAGFAARGGEVSTVFVRTRGSEAGTESYLKRLANSGKGEYVPAGSSFIGTILLAILK